MLKTSGKFFFLLAFFVFAKAAAQLSGTYQVPTTFTSLASAISALNSQGISGSVTIEVAAGYTETVPNGGYSLTTSGSALNPITFIRSGLGANPLLLAYAGGTATPVTARQDGIWSFIGCDYVTVNGIDLFDPNTTNPATMEYGFGFFKASPSDGCQNNQILNCVIRLSNLNNTAGSGTSVDGSRGIQMVNALYTSQTTALVPNVFNGTNSTNRFYSNTIQQCNTGIALIGYVAPFPYSLADQGNDIGGNVTTTGNNIVNFGGAPSAVNPAAGIRTLAQYDLNVAYNVIVNNNGSGSNHNTTLRGIFTNAAAGANTSILNNTLSISSGAATAPVAVIENLAGASANGNTVSINGNLLINCSATLNTTGTFYGIFNNAASAAVFQANGNTITNLQTTSSTGNVHLLYNTGAVGTLLELKNNVVNSFTTSASSSGSFFGIYNNTPASALLDMSGNTFSNCITSASTGQSYFIYNSGAISNSVNINANTLSASASTLSSSGSFYAIVNGGTSQALSMNQNSFTGHTVSATSSAVHMLYNTGASSGALQFNNNSFNNVANSRSAGGSFYAIYNNAASAPSLEINNNVFTQYNTAATTGSTHLIFNRGSATNTYVSASFNNNNISNCTFSASANGPVLGVYNVGVTSDNLSLSNNTVSANNWLTTTSTRYLICNSGPVNNSLSMTNNVLTGNTNTINTTGVLNFILNTAMVSSALDIANNTLSNNVNVASSGGAYYLFNSGQVPGGIINFTNNLVSSNSNSASTNADFYGIYNQGTTHAALRIANNTFSLNTLIAGTGATNLMFNTGATSTSINTITFTNNLVVSSSVTINGAGSFFGIYNNSASSQSLSIRSNTLNNLVLTASTGANHGIYNRGTITNTFSSIDISDNLLSGNTHSSAGSAAFYSIWNNGVTSTLTSILNNTVTNSIWNTNTGLRYLIANWGTAISAASISGNLVTANVHTLNTSGSLYYIFNNNNTSVSSGSLSIQSNTVTNNQSNASSGEIHFLNTSGVTTNTYTSITINDNLLTGNTTEFSAAGPFFGIYNNGTSATEINVAANTFSNNTVKSVNGSNYFIHNRGGANTQLGLVTMTNNLFGANTLSMATGGNWFGILNAGTGATQCSSLSISFNVFIGCEFKYTAGTVNLINNACPVTTGINIFDNAVSNITNTLTSTGNMFVINNGGASPGGVLNIENNNILYQYSSATTGGRYFIYNNGAVTNHINIHHNFIGGSSHTVTGTGSFYGVYNNSSASASLVSIEGNTVSSSACYAATGTSFLFMNLGTISNTLLSVQITSNIAQSFTSSSSTGPFLGAYNSGYTCNDLSIASNSLNGLVFLGTGATRQLVYNNGRVLNSLSISGNTLSNITSTFNTTGTFMGIGNLLNFANGNFPNTLNIQNNVFQNGDLSATNSPVFFISNSGVATNTILQSNISGNLFTNANITISSGGSYVGINNSAVSTATLSVNNNTLLNITCTSTNSPRTNLLNAGSAVSASFTGNIISGFTSTANTTGSYFGISNSGNVSNDLTMLNNSVMDHTVTASTGSFYPLYNTGGITGTLNVSSNQVAGITSTASSSGGFLGIFNNAGASDLVQMSGNTFTNIALNTSSGWTNFLYNRAAVVSSITSIRVQNNLVSAVSVTTNTGPFYGFFNSGSTFSDLAVHSNTFLNIATTASINPRYLFFNNGAGVSSMSFSANLVNGFSSPANTTGAFYGIFNPSSCAGNLSISSNSISNINLGATSGSAFLLSNSGVINGSITIQNNNCSAISFSATNGPFFGINNGGTSAADIDISGNAILGAVLNTSTSIRYGVYNAANSANSIALNNNNLSAFTSTASTTPAFYGVYNVGHSGSNISVSGNTLNAFALASTTGTCFMVYNTGTLTGVLNMNSNLLANCTTTCNGAGTFYGVYNQATPSSAINLNNNSANNCSVGVQGSATYLFFNNAANASVFTSSVSLNGNSVNGFFKSGTSSPFYGVYNSLISATNLSLCNNSFTNSAITGTAGLSFLVYNTGSVTSQMNLSGNTIGSFTSTQNANGDLYGVYNAADCQGSLAMSNNLFQFNELDGVTNDVMLVRNNAAVAGSLTMHNNIITGCSNTSVTSGGFYGLWNSGDVQGPLSIQGNSLQLNASAATIGDIHLLYNSGTTGHSVNIGSNVLGQSLTNSVNDFSGNLYAIRNTGGSTTSTLTVNDNVFSGFSYNGLNGSGNIYFIQNNNNNAQFSVLGNIWNNLTLKHNGNEYFIHNPSATQNSLTVSNNSITGSFVRSGSAGSTYLYYANGNSPAGCSQVFSGNNFSNITATVQGSGSFYGIYNADGLSAPYPKKEIVNNVISQVNYNGLGFFYGYYLDLLGDGGTAQGSAIYSNTLQSISHAGPLIGFGVGSSATSNYTCALFSNLAQSLSCTATNSELQGMQLSTAGLGLSVYRNHLGDLSANGSQGAVTGINIQNASNTHLYNNVIGNLYAPITSHTSALNGMAVLGGSLVNVYYNTVYLNASSTGTLFNSSALLSSGTASLDLRNNIFVNLSIPSGNGLTCAYRSTAPGLSSYLNSSNHNLFYAGIPANNRLIFHNGTAYQTLPAFKTLVTPREAASVYENPVFASVTSTAANFLRINPTIPSLTESGAQNTGITTDIDVDVRQGNPGYAGTGTAPDIGADEYDQNLSPCNSVNSGTALVPLGGINCSGTEVYMITTGYTQAGGISYQWKIANSPTGPFTSVVGGSGANSPAFNTSTLGAGSYYFRLETTCAVTSQSAASNVLTVTVNQSPTVSVSASNSTLCAGETLSFTATSSNASNFAWKGPNNFTSSVQSPVLSSVVANSSGVYSLVVSDANCTASPVYVAVQVNPTPPEFVLTPSATPLCIGNSQTLSASIPITSPTLVTGTQLGQNSASSYPAPYSLYYGGQKMQMLVLAAELSAAGFTIGSPLNSIQFPVVSKGSNWGTLINDCQNFMVALKTTTVPSLTGFETGMVNVVTPGNFTPNIGYGNTHVFSAPFIWDGSSNLIIETVFSNSIVGTSGNAVIQNNHPTGFLSTLVYRADNQSVSAIAAATNSNVNVGFVRPDFKLNGTAVGAYSWSPAAGLNTQTGTTVVATPSLSTVYTATLSNGTCSTTASSSIQVVLVPTISIVTSANTVCVGNNATLTANGAATYTWFNSTNNASLIVSPFGNTTYTLSGSNPACPQVTAAIQLISAPAIVLNTQVQPLQICAGKSSTLTVSGAPSYTWTGGNQNDTLIVTPGASSSYTVWASNGPGCWASKVVSVQVNPLPSLSITPSSATVCPGDFLTLEASGALTFTWQPGNSNSPILMINPTQSGIYDVAGADVYGCSNTASAMVIVDPCQGMKENEQSASIQMFPNPAKDHVTIQFSESLRRLVQVLNPLAQCVATQQIDAQRAEVNLQNLSAGIYLIRVVEPGKTYHYKLVVE